MERTGTGTKRVRREVKGASISDRLGLMNMVGRHRSIEQNATNIEMESYASGTQSSLVLPPINSHRQHYQHPDLSMEHANRMKRDAITIEDQNSEDSNNKMANEPDINSQKYDMQSQIGIDYIFEAHEQEEGDS